MATEVVFEAAAIEANITKEKTYDTDKDDNEMPTRKPKPPPIDISAAQELQQSSNGPKTPTSGVPQTPGVSGGTRKDKEKKIGHRRVDDEGQITYKKIQTTQIMGSIQMGIGYAVGSLASKPERDLLMQDFAMVETTFFPSEGSNITPAHHYSDFRFKTYSPVAFRYFRDLFGIQPDDFLLSVCNEPMRELTNPGASGSIFYLTNDDEFIIKTVQHKEAEFLQKLLPGYYMNLNQNPRTLLPKFFGLYNYQCGGKNVRLVAMNNLLPSSIKMHQKYDLKGSTFKRRANKHETKKDSPTYKDLDFADHHPEGILLEAETYSALMKTIQRDCRVLESFKIMDYSLLVGIHNLDLAAREKVEQRIRKEIQEQQKALMCDSDGSIKSAGPQGKYYSTNLTRSKSINRQRLAAFSTAMESIQAEVEPIDQDEDVPPGGIPARNCKGERLLLFLGIIDILQSYRFKKKLEHTWKSMLHDGDTVSVHRPSFYAQRFQDFMGKTVFKKIPSPLKHSPSKRKGTSLKLRPPSGETDGLKTVLEIDGGKSESDDPMSLAHSSEDSYSAIPGISPSVVRRIEAQMQKPRSNTDPSAGSKLVSQRSANKPCFGSLDRSDVVSISQVTIQTESVGSVMSETSSSSTSGLGSTIRTVTWTPPHSVEGSTPTHTEGTPSFTESSSSGDVGCPTTPVKMHREIVRDANTYHETEMQSPRSHAPPPLLRQNALSPISEDFESAKS